MREWPESRDVLAFLARVTRVRRRHAVAAGATVALGIAAAVTLAILLGGGTPQTAVLVAVGSALLGAGVAWLRFDASHAATAAAVETRTPVCRNVLVTATALLDNPGPTPAAICRIVMHDGAQAVSRLDPATLWPSGRPIARVGASAILCAATFLVRVPAIEQILPDLSSTTAASSDPVVSDVHLTVTPPAYAGRPPESFSNPDRVTALAGSRVEITITGTGARMRVDTAEGGVDATRDSEGRSSATITLTSDGFIGVTPLAADGTAGARRLIGVTATPDRPPVPRVTLPGKDIFLREATASLDLTVEATDDLGLRDLRLAYTKVAGVGESFTFTEGEVPLTLTRTSDRQWSGTGSLPLAALNLEVGDMVVYRAVAADHQPGRLPVESDAFILEIVSASEAMAEGFSIDDTQDKYALSQQMVILKTERLIAKAAGRPAPAAEAILEESLMIAAEQRSVRAELVFMTGGHFEDEFVEAAHEHEISDGRLDNTGRADLGRAIRDMSRAAQELTDGNLGPALESEKAALEAMQRALSRRRFILRTLTERESIDDTRRLTGTMSDLSRARRDSATPTVPAHILALRDALAALAQPDAAPLDRTMAALLTAAPGEAAVIDVVSTLSRAREALVAGRATEVSALVADATARISQVLRAAAPLSSPGDDADTRRLKGALSDVQRRGGGW